MAWELDAPSGTYKDHALSERIRMDAIADTQFPQFVNPEPGYGRHKGETLTVTRIQNLGRADRVAESDKLPEARPAIDTVSVTVSEWGQKIPLTEFEEDLTHFELQPQFRRVLRNQMSLTLDYMVATALKRTPVKAVGEAAGDPTFETVTAGSPTTLTATRNLTVADLRAIHDYFRQTLVAPPMRNNRYIGILSTKAARGIKNDPEYKDWQAPTTAQPFITGMLPREVEGFLLFESNHADSLDDTVGTGSVTGEAMFLAMDPGFLATVRDPEIRISIPDPDDLGRSRYIGWVGTLESSLIWDTAAKARGIHWTSLGP